MDVVCIVPRSLFLPNATPAKRERHASQLCRDLAHHGSIHTARLFEGHYKMNIRTTRRQFALALALLLAASAARAQSWPERPLKIVVPFSAGGTNDITARVVAEKMAG